MKKYLIRQISNNGNRSFIEMGIPSNSEIKMVWTILDEEKLFTQYNSIVGIPFKVDLQKVVPVHWLSAFAEDRMHDWTVKNDIFYYHPHSSEIGTLCDVLIIIK